MITHPLYKSYFTEEEKNLIREKKRARNKAMPRLTDTQITIIKENYLRVTNKDLAKMIGRGETVINRAIRNLGLKKPRGKIENLRRTCASNGEIKVMKSCNGHFFYIKDNGQWKLLHRYLWAKIYGPIPHRANIQFRDKNTLNCALENLYMISRKNQMMENSINRYPPELNSLIRLTHKLQHKITEHEKQD